MSEVMTRPQQQPSGALAIKRSLEQMATQFKDALPNHITPEKFQRVVLTVVNMSPELVRADKTSLLSACMKCAADGLVPDGRDAALVVFGGKVQYIPMYAGLMRRARNSGSISSISAHVVYERDHFEYRLGDDEAIEHRPVMGEDRGKLVAAYAIARFKDGSIQREVMTAADMAKVRKASRSGSGSSSPWTAWEDGMWRKSVIKRLAKYLPLDADVDGLIRHDNAVEAPVRAVETPDVTLEHETAGVDDFEAAASGVILDADAPDFTAADAKLFESISKQVTKATTPDAIHAIRESADYKAASDEVKGALNAVFRDGLRRVEGDDDGFPGVVTPRSEAA
jgi:phage RecT family recombinase